MTLTGSILRSACLLAVLSAPLAGCGRPSATIEAGPVTKFDGTSALSRVAAFVALGPKVPGTAGAERGAGFIAEELGRLGIKAEIDTFEETTPAGVKTFRNVTGLIRGKGRGLIVIGAHYDTKAGISDDFAGANDSGSGVGLLLELGAALLKEGAGPCDVLLAFFDGEECAVSYGPNDGLHGSRRLASLLKSDGRAATVKAVIIADMIGDRDLLVTMPVNGAPRLFEEVFAAARSEGVREKFGTSRNAILDDHVPFLDAGMPAVDLIDFEYGSAPGRNDYWHRTSDTMDKLSAESLSAVGRTIVRLVRMK